MKRFVLRLEGGFFERREVAVDLFLDPRMLPDLLGCSAWCVAMRYADRAPVAVLADDLYGRKYQDHAVGYTQLAFLRPWDGHPIFGPVLFVGEYEEPEGLEYGPLRSTDLVVLEAALTAIGYRPKVTS